MYHIHWFSGRISIFKINGWSPKIETDELSKKATLWEGHKQLSWHVHVCAYLNYQMILLQRDKTKLVEEVAKNFDSKFFRPLSEPVRQQLIKYLMLNGRSDIGTIAEHLPQDRSVISRHLRLMQEAGILICEKEGRFVYYSINGGEFLAKVESLVDQIRACIPICCGKWLKIT